MSWSQIVASSSLCWGDLTGTGYADHGLCVCMVVCLSQPCQISHESAHCDCVSHGWPSVCVRWNVYVWVCCQVLQAGKIPVFLVPGSWRGHLVHLWCGSSPSEQKGLVFCINFSFNILKDIFFYICKWFEKCHQLINQHFPKLCPCWPIIYCLTTCLIKKSYMVLVNDNPGI